MFSSESIEIPSPESLPSSTSRLSDIEVSLSDVYSALTSLDVCKAVGPDGISPRVLKYCAAALCARTCIFTICFPSHSGPRDFPRSGGYTELHQSLSQGTRSLLPTVGPSCSFAASP